MIVGMDGEFNLNKWNDRDSILNQRVCKIESKNENITNNNYLFHLLIPLFKKIESETSGSTVKHLSAKAINNISIPIPPLPIQQEIVRILDTFTDLDAELQAELEARRKQYEYYREKLLTFKKAE
jgi:type I restriction enzyme S subunit